MERFSVNIAKSFLGKNVNLHLKDGSVIINMMLTDIEKDELKRDTLVKCIPYRGRSIFRVSLKSIAWAELLNLHLILAN